MIEVATLFVLQMMGNPFAFSDFVNFYEDLLREELALAKRYPAHAALCIRDGWEFCRPDQAAGMFL